MFGALIQFVTGKAIHQPRHGVERVIGTVGIGGVTLFSRHSKPGGHRATTTDLDHLAHGIGAGGFAYQTDIHRFARCLHMV